MNIPYSKLKNNVAAISKYSSRDCKIFSGERQAWIKSVPNGKLEYSKIESDAAILSFQTWNNVFHHLPDNNKLQIHFVSALGELPKKDLKEYDGEDIYNDVTVNFDQFSNKHIKY